MHTHIVLVCHTTPVLGSLSPADNTVVVEQMASSTTLIKLGLLAWMLAVSWPQWLSCLGSGQLVGAPLHPPSDLSYLPSVVKK